MSFEAQITASNVKHRHTPSADRAIRRHDVFSEMDELRKVYLESTTYGQRPFRKSDAWTLELGDVLFALTVLANTTETDLHAAWTATMQKYANRLRQFNQIGSK